jgi:energy-converting hydrogenase Eha subunit E
MRTNAAAVAKLATPSQFSMFTNTLAPAISAVILLPSMNTSGSSTTIYAMNSELLVLTYAAATTIFALVLVPAVWAKNSSAFLALHTNNVVLAEFSGTSGWDGVFNGRDSSSGNGSGS